VPCTNDICGEFADPSENEKGQCTPRRLKSTCDVPIAYTNDTDQTVTIPCPEGTVGEAVSATVSSGEINNPFSVAAATAAALAQATAEATALRAATTCLYPNGEQSCSEPCPTGLTGATITVTIPAGTDEFNSSTLAEANAAALAEACAQAAALRALTPCQEVEASIILSSKTVTGEASLIGCAEFAASTPPRYYRRAEESGSLWADFSQSFVEDCSGTPQSTTTVIYGSFVQYDPDTGVPSQGGLTTLNTGGGANPVVGYTVTCGPFEDCPICHDPVGDGVNCIASIASPTVAHRTNQPGTCCQELTVLSSVLYSYNNFGEQTKTLSDEDTEADAITRLLAANPFGGWVECASFTSPNETPISCSPTTYTERVARTFNYTKSQNKVEISGLTPGVEYLVSAEITRTDLATMVSEVSAYYQFQDVATGGGTLSDEFDTPIAVGYSHEITNVTIAFV
jgi:hypothetical protein